MSDAATSLASPRSASVGDYFELMKPRVMSLVIFTGLVGMVIAPGSLHPMTAFTALLCIATGAGASAALNMAYDSDIDSLMARTARRPIPTGRIARGEALGFGWSLAAASVAIMGLYVNLLAASLLAFTILFYVAVYTLWLKRATPQNIVIGGLAGALPPAIGWAAVAGSLSLAPLVLVAMIFFWTPPHFWALALFRNGDYQRAGVPMLPVVKGKRTTRLHIFLYTLVLVPFGLAPAATGMAGMAYLVVASALSALMLVQAFLVLIETDEAREPQAKRLFALSLAYIFVPFAALLAEHVLGLAPLGAWI